MAKISVIIPAYNSEQFIAETLDSLLRQTLKDIEVIIINDGSSDGTQDIIDSYTSKYDIFKSYYQENAGVSAARNNGLEKATGEYVVFLDADDYFSDGSLEAFYNTAERTGADIVIGRLATFGETEKLDFKASADKLARAEKTDNFDIVLLWNFLVGNKCYKRERLVSSKVRFPSYRYSEEGAFFMSYVYTGAKISGAYDCVMYYRRHSAAQGLSVSQTVSRELAESFSGSLEMIYQKALEAVKNAPDTVDKDEYIQEVIYKNVFVLLSQFYRLMWHGDDDCVAYCAEEFSRLRSLMTKARLEKMQEINKDLDLDNMVSSKSEAAQKPAVCVIVGKCEGKSMTAFFNSLYDQTSPFFEVIVPRSMVSEGRIPEEYLSNENLVILDDDGYMKKAKKAAKAKRRIVIRNPVTLDIRAFRTVYRVPLPEKVITVFYPMILKVINVLLKAK